MEKTAEDYYKSGLAKYKLGKEACEDWNKAGEPGDMKAYEMIKEYCK